MKVVLFCGEYGMRRNADVSMDDAVDEFHRFDSAASILGVPPQSSLNCVEIKESGEVDDIMLFILSQDDFDPFPPWRDLLEDVCGTLAGQGRRVGDRPWMVWQNEADEPALSTAAGAS
jgi:glucose-1-phosphate cytidylyltransferase